MKTRFYFLAAIYLLCFSYSGAQQKFRNEPMYDKCIANMNSIISEINREYKHQD